VNQIQLMVKAKKKKKKNLWTNKYLIFFLSKKQYLIELCKIIYEIKVELNCSLKIVSCSYVLPQNKVSEELHIVICKECALSCSILCTISLILSHRLHIQYMSLIFLSTLFHYICLSLWTNAITITFVSVCGHTIQVCVVVLNSKNITFLLLCGVVI
jgi:hypothetical protein